MSKSLARVTRALAEAGLDIVPVEMADGTRTAEAAAAAIGCDIDQIAKSVVFSAGTGVVLFLTAGGRRVDPDRAAALAGTALARAAPDTVRRATGFAIGGVSPIGHVMRVPIWFDRHLLRFDTVWPAAGTPRHVFAIDPAHLLRITSAQVADFSS